MTTPTAPYSSEQIAGLYDLFRGRDGAYGVHDVDTGEMWTAHRSMTIRDLERHLDGSGPRVGAHPLAQDSTTTRVIVDIDAEMPGLAQRIARDLIAHELPAAIERSKSKGYHVWLFFERPVPGPDAQRQARYLADRFTWVGEYFARQDAVSEKKPFGNFVFLPLYGRDVSEGRTAFLDVDTLAVIEDQVGYLLALPKAAPEALTRLLTAFKVTTEPGRNGQAPARGAAWVRELLQQGHIGLGARHPTFRALAGRLIQRHVPIEDVEPARRPRSTPRGPSSSWLVICPTASCSSRNASREPTTACGPRT